MKHPNFALASSLAALLLGTGPTPLAALTLTATDTGFVTEAGGSAKGDGTVTPGALNNYSAGFELHYGTGALGAPLAPMMRKNYLVFDLTGVTGPLAAAKLTLWSGTLETADSSETWLLKSSTDMPGALGLSTALASGTTTAEFDSAADPLVMAASTLYGKLGDGPLVLGGLAITHAMNDSFIDVVFTPAGLGYLSGFIGGKLVLAGVVASVLPPPSPQQPFGFTGPDIAGGDLKTPTLTLTIAAVPEPTTAWLMVAGGLIGWAWHRHRPPAQRRRASQGL